MTRLGLAGLAAAPLLAQPLPMASIQAIDLGPVSGRIDHLGFDPKTQRLFVAALGNNTVEVVDVERDVHLGSVPAFREPQGIAAVPDLGVFAVANGEGDGIEILDAKSYARIRRVRLGDDADNVRYDGSAQRLYVGYGRGALAAVSPSDGRVVGEARLAGHPESFQLERSGVHIYVNVPTASQIAVVDRRTMTVTATWPVRTATANFPMALDEAGHRLFIGCRRPAKALVYDTDTGREITSFDIVGDTDDLFYDASRRRLYVSGGEGFLDSFREQDAARFIRVAHIPTAPGARTSLFVPERSRLYVAVPHRGAQRAELRVLDVR